MMIIMEQEKGINGHLNRHHFIQIFLFWLVIMTYHLRGERTAIQSWTIAVTLVRKSKMEGVHLLYKQISKMVKCIEKYMEWQVVLLCLLMNA